MRTNRSGRLPAALLGAVLAATTLLASCGGGVGSGGTGQMAGGGYGRGTITGFGSVIVDGLRYDDSDMRVEYDTEDGAPDAPGRRLARADLAEGQRVELEFELDGQARRASVLRISPALVGPVTSLAPLAVAGQPVQVNGDAARGPLTRFGGGLSSGRQIKLGDRLEVHGVPAGGPGAALQATRIERLAATHGPWLRLSGMVSGLAADGGSFRLGALTVIVAQRGNARPALANGQRVQVWTRDGIADGTLAAERVKVVQRALTQPQEVQISGAATACFDRPRPTHVCVGGMPVALEGARYGGGLGAAALDAGRYVVVTGRFDPGSGAVTQASFGLPPP